VTLRRCGLFLALFCAAWAFGVMGCGDSPSGVPNPYTGSLRIAAMDTLIFDSISVGLDDISLGKMGNPCTLKDVIVGTHRLTVQDSSGARVDTLVAVRRNEMASLVMRLTRIGPFVGNEAPDFSARDIDNRNLDLASLRGKVVFLVFFEYT